MNGIYRSTNTGATWTKVSTPEVDSFITNSTVNVEFSVSGDTVYVGMIGIPGSTQAPDTGALAAVFRSGDGGDSWESMGVPTTIEDGVAVGASPGGQGSRHFSIQADPQDDSTVYVGGDRQPFLSEFTDRQPPFWPNSINGIDFSGRLFRGEFVDASTTNWTPLTHIGTASNSSPHADSREMAFDANGNLIEVDDGGIYRRTSPQNASGDWFSINGDLSTTEYHGIAYDSLSDIIIGGAQDVGTTEQLAPDGAVFRSVSTADGGDVAVDNLFSETQSVRYSSFQFPCPGTFRRRVMNASGGVVSTTTPALMATSGPPLVDPITGRCRSQFYTPLAINAVESDRLLFGAGPAAALYESTNGGQTIASIGTGLVVNAFTGDPLIYGVPGNADLVMAAILSELYTRTTSPPDAVTLNSVPTGQLINSLAINPENDQQIFALSSAEVAFSSNFGTNWTDITGNLGSFNPRRLRALAFAPGDDPALLVGSDRGIFVAFESSGYSSWSRLGGANLPNAPVFELDYDIDDDVLVAGLLGRGAWKYIDASDLIFGDRFENEVN